MADASIDDFLGVKPQAPWKRYIKWVAIAVGVVLLCLLLARCFGAKEQTQYSTQAAQRGNLTVTVSATGKLAPTTQVTVGSQLSGLVTKVVVDVNDRVVAGQPLALIDPERSTTRFVRPARSSRRTRRRSPRRRPPSPNLARS
jgi:HlyD family secretion protein